MFDQVINSIKFSFDKNTNISDIGNEYIEILKAVNIKINKYNIIIRTSINHNKILVNTYELTYTNHNNIIDLKDMENFLKIRFGVYGIKIEQ
jgi:hypothetical protein